MTDISSVKECMSFYKIMTNAICHNLLHVSRLLNRQNVCRLWIVSGKEEILPTCREILSSQGNLYLKPEARGMSVKSSGTNDTA